jgi:ubiquinone biosynthesis protein COQ4
LRDTHDLLHLLSGIGRDTLGEQALGAYVFGQRPSHGHLMLGIAGAAVIRAKVTTKAPVMRAIFDAKRTGKACRPIAEESITDLLAMTIDQARAFLNIRPARIYEQCQTVWQEEGVDPVAILAKEDPSAGTRPAKGKKGKIVQPGIDDRMDRGGKSAFAFDAKRQDESTTAGESIEKDGVS